MSKFIDRLKQLAEGAPQPIGFRPGGPAPSRLKIQLVAEIADNGVNADSLKEADAILVKGTEFTTPVPGNASGIRLAEGSTEGFEAYEKAGADFIVYPAEMPFQTVHKKTGKILEIESGIADSQLRSLSGLPIDAVLATHKYTKGLLTWQDLMVLQRLASAISKPLLVTIPEKMETAALQAMWDAGIDGIVVDITGKTADMTSELRKMITELSFPDVKNKERFSAMVPRVSTSQAHHEEEHEEEEEEDDE